MAPCLLELVFMLPNFLVIGAAKAGTTALHWYLAEHPAVFMTQVKDPSYFAYGLNAKGQVLWGESQGHRFPVRSFSEYERLFVDAGNAAAIGEASTMYLECPQSAARIKEQLPAARLICSLRHPVDRAYSDYQMYLRRRGRRLNPARDLAPTAEWAQPDSRWMRIGRYHEKLSRYFDAFPPAQLHVFLFDDLKRDRLRVVQEVYRFLEVDPQFIPDFDTPHNIGGVPASFLLENLFANRTIRSLVAPWVPVRAANWARRLRTRNMRQAPPLPTDLKAELTAHFRDDIIKTSKLIGRNLEHWL
jgi:sulfotransferase family protein